MSNREESPISHDHLWSVTKRFPEDYAPHGSVDRWEVGAGSDCSCGCRWFAKLEGDLGMDWGVCTNPASHRVGLLTFEHMGCSKFEPEGDEERA